MFRIDSQGPIFFLAAFFLFFIPPSISFSQTEESAAIFTLRGNTRMLSGKATEGVEMELKKDGRTISKIYSGKNGKYSIQMDINTTNPKHEYILHITQAGTIPKSVILNTYISQEEFNTNGYARYQFDLEIKMIETTSKDIVIEKPSGKIRWDSQQKDFIFDQVYAKVIQKEEEKPKEDPDKRKKEEAELARKKAEEAWARAEEDEKRLADQKSKEEADKILQQNLEAVKQELRKKRRQDSLDSLATLTAKKPDIKLEKPISPQDVDQNAFDGTRAYSINVAMKTQKMFRERANKEKSKNLSAKYETINTLTSLLNVVDEVEKKEKRQ